MEVEEKKRAYCDQIPYFCYQKKNRGPLPKVRRVVVGSKSGAALCFLILLACIRHYFPRQGGNLNCAGAHHGTRTPPRISPSCVSRSIIVG